MPIPNFQTIMLPLLRHMSDGQIHATADTREAMAREFALTEGEIGELLPSGSVPRFSNRVAWAKSHLKAAGLVESPRRGEYRITDAGQAVLANPPEAIDLNYLDRFPGHAAFRTPRKSEPKASAVPTADELTPIEQIERSVEELRSALAEDVLEAVLAASPRFLEQLTVDLLLAMGYGGSREDAGQALGKSGDEGVDGVINEDRLGLDAIYIQAKRYRQGSIGRPDLQAFAGALQGKKARKGIFITTSTFSPEARQFASSIENRIVLIDGRQLADLMITHGVGVTVEKSYRVSRMNSDYFSEEGD